MALFDFLAPKPDHPLGASPEARKVADALTRREPRDAVEEAMAWFESLTGATGFRLHLLAERLLQLENAAVPQARRLGRDYLAMPAGTAGANALWAVAHRFWSQLAAAHMHVLTRHQSGGRDNILKPAQAAHVYAAALNACAAVQKWQQYRYRRLTDSFWETAGALYLRACDHKIDQRPVELYSGYGQTSVEGEYLRIVLFHVAAMDTLPPLEIELGERLIAHFLRHFSLERELKPGSAYWVDAGTGTPPARLIRVPESRANLRFLNGTAAHAESEKLGQRIRIARVVPADLILGGNYPVATVQHALDHLAMAWSSKPPVRDHVRRPVQAPLAVIHGFREAMQTIAYAASETRTRIPDLELWSVSDVSLGGMAIHGTLGRNPWPCIGMLVTMKPDGNGNWLVGVVRRFSRNPEPGSDEAGAILTANPNFASLGIETLSRAAAAVMGDANGLTVDMIILDTPAVAETIRVLVPPNTVEPGIPVTFILNGQSGRLMPQDTVANGPDYSVVRFIVQSFF